MSVESDWGMLQDTQFVFGLVDGQGSECVEGELELPVTQFDAAQRGSVYHAGNERTLLKHRNRRVICLPFMTAGERFLDKHLFKLTYYPCSDTGFIFAA